MSSKAPIAILEHSLEAHPARRAWGRIHGGRPAPVRVEVWREMPRHRPASVYRLVFADDETPAVFAKHSERRFGAVEWT